MLVVNPQALHPQAQPGQLVQQPNLVVRMWAWVEGLGTEHKIALFAILTTLISPFIPNWYSACFPEVLPLTLCQNNLLSLVKVKYQPQKPFFVQRNISISSCFEDEGSHYQVIAGDKGVGKSTILDMMPNCDILRVSFKSSEKDLYTTILDDICSGSFPADKINLKLMREVFRNANCPYLVVEVVRALSETDGKHIERDILRGTLEEIS